jgi:phosphoserine phosphatase RsbU/P
MIAILGDLMGKGLPAAMWITHIVDLFHRATEDFKTLPTLMERLNAELCQSRVRAPLTSAFVLMIDSQSGEVRCSSAGHPPSILVRSDTTTELLSEGGPLLGVFADAKYKAQALQLQPGDAIVSFSDGLVEAEGQSQEQFSVSRAAMNLARHAALGASQKLTALLEASREFTERAGDDISAMVVQHA